MLFLSCWLYYFSSNMAYDLKTYFAYPLGLLLLIVWILYRKNREELEGLFFDSQEGWLNAPWGRQSSWSQVDGFHEWMNGKGMRLVGWSQGAMSFLVLGDKEGKTLPTPPPSLSSVTCVRLMSCQRLQHYPPSLAPTPLDEWISEWMNIWH